MQVKFINRPIKGPSPQAECMLYAARNGFTIEREPFGKRGSCIEVYVDGTKIDYRKSYGSALKLMQAVVSARPAAGTAS